MPSLLRSGGRQDRPPLVHDTSTGPGLIGFLVALGLPGQAARNADRLLDVDSAVAVVIVAPEIAEIVSRPLEDPLDHTRVITAGEANDERCKARRGGRAEAGSGAPPDELRGLAAGCLRRLSEYSHLRARERHRHGRRA